MNFTSYITYLANTISVISNSSDIPESQANDAPVFSKFLTVEELEKNIVTHAPTQKCF
jgi:hypothetical protein